MFQILAFGIVRFCKKNKAFIGNSTAYIVLVEFVDNSIDFFLSIEKPFYLDFVLGWNFSISFLEPDKYLSVSSFSWRKMYLQTFCESLFTTQVSSNTRIWWLLHSHFFLAVGRADKIIHIPVFRHQWMVSQFLQSAQNSNHENIFYYIFK